MEEQETKKKSPLSQSQAENRKLLLVGQEGKYFVNYNLLLAIRRSVDKNSVHAESEYDGKLVITFAYYPKENVSSDEFLFFDFTGKVNSVSVNGHNSNFSIKDDKIFFDKTNLKPSANNEVVILFNNKYNHGGVGLHHYIDPIDKKEYLYTQFEPFDCHQFFPCFDQPDLKAFLELTVIAPNEWVVLSNESEKWSKSLNEGSTNDVDIKGILSKLSDTEFSHLIGNSNLYGLNYSIHTFVRTPRISSYLFALCAGQYYCINNPIEYEVPLRVFCRESLKRSGDPLEFFKVTIEGMEWYKKFFGIAYPFKKYDQIFCPEYNMGAMENVGLVTYNEVYCFKEVPTQRRKTYFAITVLHELAHMWFGNLVTMKWWDDLWLNESFATFISHLCLAEAPGLKHYTTSWLVFNDDKGNAFRADQKSTTHPVMGDVKNTEVAETHFDEIVYEKGSSFLKQLFKFVGYDNFSKGIQNYFQVHKWENTEFHHFIDQMVLSTGNKNLAALCDSFLRKAGLNEIVPEYVVGENNLISEFKILQTPCLADHANLQYHLVDVLFIYNEGNTKTFSNVEIQASGVTNIQQFVGQPAPNAIVLNYNDWGYFKSYFDSKSTVFLEDNLYNKSYNFDDLTRQIYYRSLFDMVRDAKLSSVKYIKIIQKLIPNETNQDIINTVIRNLNGVVTYYIPDKYYSQYQIIAYGTIRDLLNRSGLTDDVIQTLVLNTVLTTDASQKDQVETLRDWLVNGVKYTKNQRVFPQNIRFIALSNIFASNFYSLEEKQHLLEEECKRDNNSDESELARLTCRASLPDIKIKTELFNKFVNEPLSESLYKMQALMSGFAQKCQSDLVEDFMVNKFPAVVVEVGKKVEFQYIQSFIHSLFPTFYVNESVISKMDKLIETIESDSVRRVVAEDNDDLKRFLRAHKVCLADI